MSVSKKLVSAVLALLMAVAMCACDGSSTSSASGSSSGSSPASSGGTDSSAGSTPAANGGNTLTAWCWDPAFNIYAIKAAAEEYQKDHPDFQLDVREMVWDDIQTSLITAASSGNMETLPDIFLCQNNAFQKNVINYPDLFTDLTSSGIKFDDFTKSSVAYSTVDGKNYGCPFDNGVAVFALRTDILEEAGFTIDDFTDATWDDVIEKGKVVKEKTGKSILSFQAGSADMIIMMLKSCGSSLFNEDGTVNMVENPYLLEAFNTCKELIESGVMIEYNSWDEYVGSFVNDSVAGTINGCWILASIQTAQAQSGKWAVTNFPKFAGQADSINYSENGGSSWAISSVCKDPELAMDFLSKTFAGSTDFYDSILQDSGALANYIPAGATDKYAEPVEFFGGQKVYSELVDYAGKVKAFNTGVYYYEAATAIGTQITNVVNGTDPAQAIKAAQDETEFNMQ